MAFRRKPRAPKAIVKWVTPEAKANSAKNVKKTIPYYLGENVIEERVTRSLTIGSMWTPMFDLTLEIDQTRHGGFQVLRRNESWSVGPIEILKRSLMIYAGIEHIEEVKRDGKVITVPRHIFLSKGIRYVLFDLSLVLSATERPQMVQSS